ncbi:hypothetical protein BGX29_007827 [Mortierella sp. GBA35]|nr:hypothetical protein BGX23_008434 [Mortierella sp. AD031]KAF9098019.1 hypothetical protein BGX29_007827 [Mortierella sp. GBA35]KAG0205579.1 hypothetical protein BGX33_007859 [Mortierella sp. NVP41]
MKLTFAALAVVAIAASTQNVRALPKLFKRVGNDLAAGNCIMKLLNPMGTGVFDAGCKNIFESGELRIVESIILGALNFDFSDPDPLKVTLSSPEMTVRVKTFSGISIPITAARQNVTLEDNGINIATFQTPWSDGTMKGSDFLTSVGNSLVNVDPIEKDNFSKFIATLTTNPSHTFVLKGTVEAKLSIKIPSSPFPLPGSDNLGSLKDIIVPGVAFRSEVTLSGFNNFPKITYIKELVSPNFAADAATIAANGLSLVSQVNIFNPSQLGVVMGAVRLNTFDSSKKLIGVTEFKALTLVSGENILEATTTSNSPDMVETYKRITTQGDTLSFEGFAGSSDDPVLANGIAALGTTVVIFPDPAPAPA